MPSRDRNPKDLTSRFGSGIEVGSFSHTHDTVSLSVVFVIVRCGVECASVVPDGEIVGVPSVAHLKCDEQKYIRV